jgi:hypothetical protein
MPVVLPHHFKDAVGEVASGVQVTENDEALAAAIEVLQGQAIGAPSVMANFGYSEEHEASATNAALVVISAIAGAAGVTYGIELVGIGEVARSGAPANLPAPCIFLVPAGKKWKGVLLSGSFTAAAFYVSTTLLGRK